ncbi:MAG: L,D-transpeptidase family protein [Actinomycetota bacterium]
MATAMVLAGCGGPPVDPLSDRSPVGPTVEVELTEREAYSTVATASLPRIEARVAPDLDAEVIVDLAHPTESGAPLVFQVISERDGWVEVLLPVRPNGSTGWVLGSAVELTRNQYRIEVDTGTHRLTLFERGRVRMEVPVAIGTGATPTPLGEFYLTELLQPPDPTGPYGTYAYGLSGYSETLQSFNGGDGVIGLHGTNEPSSLGSDVSHGCVRLANETINELVKILPLGTPVVITGPSS